MAFDSQHRVWTPLFNFNGLRNSVPFPLTPAAPSTALAAVGVQVTWPDAHVYRYRVYRDGALIATLAGQSYNDTAVASGTHDYTISVGLADQVTWSPQSPASTISLSAGSLVFSQPPDYIINLGPQSLDLSQFVSGGNPQKWYFKLSGTFPRDVSLGTNTGAIGTEFLETGSFSMVIRVTDTRQDALEADWLARSTAPGVKWAHDFRSDTEVTKFLVQANSGGYQYDSNNVPLTRRIATDGITGGGCLELFTPSGTQNTMRWMRPFNALPGDVGYTSGPDLPSLWFTDTWGTHRYGLYGHSSYHSDNLAAGIKWDGTHFYLQFRYKVSASGFGAGQPTGYTGKLAFIELAGGNDCELVLQSPVNGSKRLWMYTNFGSRSNSYLSAVQGDTNDGAISQQPGGEYAGLCVYDTDSNLAGCWQWPTDEWVTVLIHVIPGMKGPGSGDNPDMSSTSRRRDTGIEMWVARAGATSYTKVWEKFDYTWWWEAQTGAEVNGFNVFAPSQYMNSTNATADWYRRFDQVIFSTQFIECPRV